MLTAGLGVKNISDEAVTVLVPCYRMDVMHQVDIIEDVAIAYGYNNIEPTWRELPTTGKAKPEQRYIDIARELMVGLRLPRNPQHHTNQPRNTLQKNEYRTHQNYRTRQPQNLDHDMPA